MYERKETVEVQMEKPHVDSLRISNISSACFRIVLPKFLSQYQVDKYGIENNTKRETQVQCQIYFVIFVVG